jgi:CubicO group peptidase (beta-lactamase class C family)
MVKQGDGEREISHTVASRASLQIFPPGAQARYSNSGYILLGMVVEKASGEPYGSFLQKNILEPLGMRDTGVDNDAEILPSGASGYRTEGGALRHADFIDMRVPFAAGDLYSTTYGLARWQEALFGGKLLRPDSLKRMTTPVPVRQFSPVVNSQTLN